MTAHSVPLRGRRFVVRFLGRPWTWVWLAATLVPFVAGWLLVALPARGSPADERTWALWSGNVLLALFVLTMGFSARKWSIKLRFVRDMGRAPPGSTDAAWADLQRLNRRALEGAYRGADDAEVAAAAAEILQRHGVQGSQRVEIGTLRVGERTVRFVRARKREPLGRLEPWLEMHMGVGTVACLAVWLHADMVLRHPVGWLLALLSVAVLVSGLAGAALYRVVPPLLARADPGIPYEEAGVAAASHHECLAGVLRTLDADLRAALRPLLRRARSAAAIAQRADGVIESARALAPGKAELVRDLVVMAGTRDRLRLSTRPARRLDFALRIWKWAHVPLSALLLLVVALHVLLVIWY